MLRSLVFYVVFYLNTAVFLIVGSPLLLGPRSWAMAGAQSPCSRLDLVDADDRRDET